MGYNYSSLSSSHAPKSVSVQGLSRSPKAFHQWLLHTKSSSLQSLSFSYFSPFSQKPISLYPSETQKGQNSIPTVHPPHSKPSQTSTTSSPSTASQRVSSQTTSSPIISPTTALSASSSQTHVTFSLTSWSTMTRKSTESWAMGLCPVCLGFKPKSCLFGSRWLGFRPIRGRIQLSSTLVLCRRSCQLNSLRIFRCVRARPALQALTQSRSEVIYYLFLSVSFFLKKNLFVCWMIFMSVVKRLMIIEAKEKRIVGKI